MPIGNLGLVNQESFRKGLEIRDVGGLSGSPIGRGGIPSTARASVLASSGRQSVNTGTNDKIPRRRCIGTCLILGIHRGKTRYTSPCLNTISWPKKGGGVRVSERSGKGVQHGRWPLDPTRREGRGGA